MGAHRSNGFTIIETMLFLAVTGLLILGVLVGTSAALNNQRYRDAVESFKSLLQQQYADLGAVSNGRENVFACSVQSTGLVVQNVGAANGQTPGQSDCTVAGKYLRIDKKTVWEYTVLAAADPSVSPATGSANDLDVLSHNYFYAVASSEETSDTLEWNTNIAWPLSGGGAKAGHPDRALGVLFLRSPNSGAVYTFTSDTIPADSTSINNGTLRGMISAGARGQRTICIESGGLMAGGDMAVSIAQYASSSSAIEIRSNDVMKATMGSNPPQC